MKKLIGGSWTNDTIELRLPLKPQYLPILRATTGVVAGVVGFNYDEIMQLRVAVSEVFDLALKHVTPGSEVSEVNELAEDIADELSEQMEDDPELRRKIVDAAVANPEFKKRIVKKLVEELSD